MNLSEYENDQTYRRIIEMIEPRHVPVTSMKFTPPRKKRVVRQLILWSSRAAALFIVTGLATLFISQSQPTNGAVKVIESAIDNIRSSGYCNIEFSARILPTQARTALKMSPRGELQPVTMTFLSDSINREISLRWNDGQTQHQLTAYPGKIVRIDNTLISDITMPSEAFSIMSNLLFSPNPDSHKILDSNTLEMTTKGDDIFVRNVGKNKKVEFCMTFSKSTGRLLDFHAYDTSYGKKILMIKTNKISYKRL
ncbi:MAG: hypothetical protein K2M16_03730 [Muribaculaceae bacterium]|nr:hypothetical protein [Muribaculaceae bacterium]